MSSLNQIILPKRIVDEYQIKPHDLLTFLGKRARRVGVIVFGVSLHKHNNSVAIPKQIVEFCGFEPGSKIKVKLIRVIHTTT